MSLDSETRVAKILLEIKAVTLRPSQPFKWVSGIYAPIYCDNRIIMSHVKERREVIDLMASKAEKEIGLSNFAKVCGVATSGIPYAAWLSEKISKPMIYARSKEKDHGKGNIIEGELEEGERVVMVEDLISTGQSSLACVESVRQKGGKCTDCLAIFNYEMGKAKNAFPQAGCKLFALTRFSVLAKVAVGQGFIKKEELQSALDWSANPQGWSDRYGK